MIAAGADVSGTSIPLTLVRTTGKETGLAVAFSPATVDACDNVLFDDEARLSPPAAAAANLLSDGITCAHVADAAAGPVCPGTCEATRGSFSTGAGVAGADVKPAESRERLRDKLTAAGAEAV